MLAHLLCGLCPHNGRPGHQLSRLCPSDLKGLQAGFDVQDVSRISKPSEKRQMDLPIRGWDLTLPSLLLKTALL